MKDSQLFTIRQFARLSRTTVDTLRHYDKIGLLSPLSRGQNNYRLYSSFQLPVVNVIRTLQALGISLADIRALKDQRTPQLADAVFTRQIEEIDAKIAAWNRARQLLLSLRGSIRSALDVDENAITLQSLPAEPIALGETNDYSKGADDFDALLRFYHAMQEKYPDMNLNYPVWGLFSGARIAKGDWRWPDRYYFSTPEGRDERPAGLYAIAYARGGYGQGGEAYRRLLRYIEERALVICGDAYEEYPLNEVCVTDESQYLIRVMIMVQPRGIDV